MSDELAVLERVDRCIILVDEMIVMLQMARAHAERTLARAVAVVVVEKEPES